MGRSVANEGFLRALLAADPFGAYHFYLSDARQLEILQDRLAGTFPDMLAAGRFVLETQSILPRALSTHEFHCFHLSDCLLHNAPLAALRNRYARHCMPITGCTHTLSYARYMPMFFGHLWQGCCPRDAVIATSRAAEGMVSRVYAHFREGYGVSLPAPQIARIPLGIDAGAFPAEREPLRAQVRASLGLGEDAVLLLVFARVSHYSKMDLLPLLRALQRLALGGMPMQSLHLVVAGQIQPGDSTPQVLAGLARSLGVSLQTVGNPDDGTRNGLYAAADIFVSPVDNMQETFGLTLLEAGLMGLPVIASDYDGYRDLVLDGETGILVPTLGPADTADLDVMAPLAFDTATHLGMAQRTVVDVPALAVALRRLVTDRTLRLSMGERARTHVRARYDWPVIIGQHLELWDRLHAEPVDAEALRSVRHPLQTAYGEIFGGYPTERLDGGMRVVWSTVGEAVYRGREKPVIYEGIAHLVAPDHLGFMLFCARKPLTVAALNEMLLQHVRDAGTAAGAMQTMEHVILWALKHDMLERA